MEILLSWEVLQNIRKRVYKLCKKTWGAGICIDSFQIRRLFCDNPDSDNYECIITFYPFSTKMEDSVGEIQVRLEKPEMSYSIVSCHVTNYYVELPEDS